MNGRLLPRLERSSKKRRKSEKKVSQSSAMDYTGKHTTTRPNFIMVNSGKTSHMTARSESGIHEVLGYMKTNLAGDTTVWETRKGIRKVKWKYQSAIEIIISKKIIAPDSTTSLL